MEGLKASGTIMPREEMRQEQTTAYLLAGLRVKSTKSSTYPFGIPTMKWRCTDRYIKNGINGDRL